jgi:V/A-type H+/Na+-transporting ATPase subunit F
MHIVAIGDHNTVTAFRLAGVAHVHDMDQGRSELRSILADDQVGIVIVTERFAQDNQQVIDSHKTSKRITPIIVEVPDSTGPIDRKADPISELIRRAVGADVA